MFLNELKLKQKNAFLELAYMIANIDETIIPEEKSLIQAYESEMQIPSGTYQVRGLPLKSILKEFTDKSSQKIVYIEILALARVDLNVCEKEQSIISEIEKFFNLKAQDRSHFLNWLGRFDQLYAEGLELVNGN